MATLKSTTISQNDSDNYVTLTNHTSAPVSLTNKLYANSTSLFWEDVNLVTTGGAANTIERLVAGTITSLGDGVTNTVYVQVEANTTLAGSYSSRLTITGNDSNAINTFSITTDALYVGSSTTVTLTDTGSAERLGNDTLGSGAVQVTVGTPANINSTAFEIPVAFKNTDSGNAKTNAVWKIFIKVYGDTALTNVYSSYTT